MTADFQLFEDERSFY